MDLEKNGKGQLEDKVSNEEVLVRIGEKRKLIGTITERKKRWIGHVLKGRDC